MPSPVNNWVAVSRFSFLEIETAPSNESTTLNAVLILAFSMLVHGEIAGTLVVVETTLAAMLIAPFVSASADYGSPFVKRVVLAEPPRDSRSRIFASTTLLAGTIAW
eukprot:CAMPEP_0184708586 /NCGR_PEP_ID=MMETSP0313-20130426/37853_1 /TAXON_ID=2792 /ORGANISM="Porphyridium aerugineum, Strain SAG 1380-2" /LENGTH=106 /DNA_ID=CAMNT_0027170183 /DNA_START=148 /DNA_END=465 /DNA_ORIENTATION=-